MTKLAPIQANDFSSENLEKALISARGIRELFREPYYSLPPEDNTMNVLPYEKWNEYLYAYVQHALYEVIGSFEGPNGRSFAAAYILSEEEVTELSQESVKSVGESAQGFSAKPLRMIRDYKNLSIYAYERLGGIALLERRELSDPPEASLNFGSVWASVHYHHPAGNENVVDAFKKAYEILPFDPLSAIVSKNGEQQWGEPSDEFLPHTIRELMIEEIQKIIPGIDAEILLLRREEYAMPYRIVLDTHADYSSDIKDALTAALRWYMPPYLPIMVI